MHEIADDLVLPVVLGIWRHEILQHPQPIADAIDTAATPKWLHDQTILLILVTHPVHAMDTWLVIQFDRRPQLRPVSGRDEIKDGSIFECLPEIPLPADRDFAFAVPIDISGRDADVVALGQIAGDDVFRPLGILIPLNRVLVGENDVRLPVTVHVGQLEAVADLDLVYFHGPPFEFRNRVGRHRVRKDDG